MSVNAEQLAERFVRSNEELIVVAEGCSEAGWEARCDAEGWSVGVTVHHVAEDYLDLVAVIEAVAAGEPAPVVTQEMLERRNAEHARRFVGCTREETVALLRRNGEAVAGVIRGLRDDQLMRSGEVLGRERSVAGLIDPVLLGHIQGHLASVRAAVL